MARRRLNITIAEDTYERLQQYVDENHIGNGLSGGIEDLVWKAKVKNDQVRGQISLKERK